MEYLKKKDQISNSESCHMVRSGLLITTLCNLHCKQCGAYIPYLKDGRHSSVEEIQDILQRYFKIVDHVEKFSITGGEPLLHPQLPKILQCMIPYLKQCDEIVLFSNGTIVPDQDVLAAAKLLGSKFSFVFDNYGKNISKKIPEINQVMKNEEIFYFIRNYTEEDPHCGGWVDLGQFKEVWKSDEEAIHIFSKCAYPQKLKFCFSIFQNGIMCENSYYKNCHERGLLKDNDHEFINLYDDSLTIEQQREKIRALYQINVLTACKYCTGMCDDSQRFVPGQQLTAQEMEYVKLGARNYHELITMKINLNNKTIGEKG